MELNYIIKVTTACNMGCKYCYYRHNSIHSSKNKMDGEIAKRIIDNSLNKNDKHASFIWHGGEPLLIGIDFFKEVIQYQSEALKKKSADFQIENCIQTNALLLNEDWIKFFKENNFRIGISVDGFYEIQSKNRCTSIDHYGRIINNIKLMKHYNLDFSVLTVVTNETLGKEAELFDFFAETGITSFGFLPMNYGNLTDCIKPDDYGNFLCNFFDIWLSKQIENISIRDFDDFIRWHLGKKAIQCTHCDICHQYFTVIPNGDLYPCDCFGQKSNLKIGTIFDEVETTLENNRKIYTGAEVIPNECQTCKFLGLCRGGCKYFRFIKDSTFKEKQYYCSSYKKLYNKMQIALEQYEKSL